jgi:hypothetical protein
MGVVFSEERMVLDLVHVLSTQPAFACSQQVPDQENAAGTHDNVVWEGQGLLVIHDVGVSSN